MKKEKTEDQTPNSPADIKANSGWRFDAPRHAPGCVYHDCDEDEDVTSPTGGCC